MRQDVLARIAPGMDARIELCSSLEFMARESRGSLGATGRSRDERFRVYRGSTEPAALPLPWLDEEQALFIAVGDYGDDTGFALDYRADPENPRVVGGFWEGQFRAMRWIVVAASFAEFATALGFTCDG